MADNKADPGRNAGPLRESIAGTAPASPTRRADRAKRCLSHPAARRLSGLLASLKTTASRTNATRPRTDEARSGRAKTAAGYE